ncbi:rCG35273, partial [Rattus norvegicus]
MALEAPKATRAAENGEVRTYLSLLSTPSWIHLSTSPQSIM